MFSTLFCSDALGAVLLNFHQPFMQFGSGNSAIPTSRFAFPLACTLLGAHRVGQVSCQGLLNLSVAVALSTCQNCHYRIFMLPKLVCSGFDAVKIDTDLVHAELSVV